jgi:hypothetical protein
MDKFLSRKYILSIVLIALSYVLVLVGKISPKEWIDFTMVVAGGYLIGNVGSKFADKIK